MINIKGEGCTLRAVEPTDIDCLYVWENDMDLWSVSGTVAPFSYHTLERFIDSQSVDIFASRQMRLMICESESGVAVGVLDMFEFDPIHRRAGVGILIASEFRGRGYATAALLAFERYVVEFLSMRLLWCNIEEDNVASISLFESVGYSRVGLKRDWNISAVGFKSEFMFQKLL
ncbi:MAG: GNAT family N-acetyltransferase [Rikenellaceae bacterium]